MKDLIEFDTRMSWPSRWLKGLSVLASVGILLFTGVTEAFFAPDKPRLVGDEKREMARAEANVRFRDGSLARSIETDFRLRGRVRRFVAPFWSYLLLQLRDVPTRSVILGDDGFLFLRERAELAFKGRKHGPQIMAGLFGAVDRALAGWGSRMVVVPIPRKATACGAFLPSGIDTVPDFDLSVIRTMKERGLQVVDLFPAWQAEGRDKSAEPLYIPHETHWSHRGCESFANEIRRQAPNLPRDTTSIETFKGPVKRTLANLGNIGLRLDHPTYEWAAPRNETGLALLPFGREARLNDGSEPAQILLSGSSFSQGFFGQTVLTSVLQAPVADCSLRGRLPLAALQSHLLRRKARDTPPFVLLEFPIHQSAAVGRRSDPMVRGGYAIVNRLNFPGRRKVLSQDLFPSTRRTAPSPRKAAVVFPSGTLLSSGDGVMTLRLSVSSVAVSRWRILSSATDLTIKIPAGQHVRLIPLAEHLPLGGQVELRTMDAPAVGAEFKLDVMTDADLASATVLSGSIDRQGTWTFAGPGSVQPHDALVLRWNEALAGGLEIRAVGENADGSEFRRTWTFRKATGGRFAIVSLGALDGATLSDVIVEGGNATMSCTVAPLRRAR